MGYKNAIRVLPDDLIMAIQEYIDGEYLYIPRKEESKKGWGESCNSRQILDERNATIFDEYKRGIPVLQLANKFSLSPKTIYKILSAMEI